MRFGNKAFRVWLERVQKSANTEIAVFSSLPDFEKAIPEISVYLQESFGSHERLDYGTGHELNFVMFLFCLFKLGVLLADDLKGAINKVFQRYMELMRLI